jgi:lipid II:glycine glycyltransferase (peptidoglycan interpeptide bridge formation enzyme)
MNTSSSIAEQWDKVLAAQRGHLLQSWAWGELKSHFGWTAERVQVAGAAAQILFRRLPLGQTIAYIPKGPVVDWSNSEQCRALFAAIRAVAQKRRAIFLKIEPDVLCQPDNSRANAAACVLSQHGFTCADTIQPQSSILVDIRGDDETILSAMKQKTRYNIRLAERKGVTIRQGNKTDLSIFYDLSRQTAARDGFGIHSRAYYQTAYRLFAPQRCVLLLAEFAGEPLAGLMAFCFGQMAYYFYGASANAHRNLMATYLIQWAAIQWAKNQGCATYDLWGIPAVNVDALEAEFSNRNDGLWGVYRFKRGFGGQVVKSIGAYDYIYHRPLYRLYRFLKDSSRNNFAL